MSVKTSGNDASFSKTSMCSAGSSEVPLVCGSVLARLRFMEPDGSGSGVAIAKAGIAVVIVIVLADGGGC